MKINLNYEYKGKGFMGGKADLGPRWSLIAHQGDVVHCMTESGPSTDFCYHICLDDNYSTDCYVLKTIIHGKMNDDFDGYINARTVAESLIVKMKEKGELDLTHWRKC